MSKVTDFLKNNADTAKSLSSKKIWIVTGVAGFIGSHIADALLELGQTVRGIDNFSTGRQLNIDYLRSQKNAGNFAFLEADINDSDKLRDFISGSDYLIHQAALGSVPRSIDKPLDTHYSNVTGFINILTLAKEAGLKRIVYASSSSVYGDSETLPKVEAQVGKVLSPYAASKMCNEVYADSFANSYGLELVGLRYFNVFGARQDPDGPYAAVIPRWVDRLAKQEACEIYGDGETSRDFCYIDNVVLANILGSITQELPSKHQVYNVACGDRTTLNDLFGDISAQVAELLGKEKQEAVYKDFRAGDIRHSHANIDKISSELRYLPLVYRKEGIESTVKSFLDV